MSWYWWLLLLPPLVWLIGYLRRRRSPLLGQHGITYHFRSEVARWAARMRGSRNNYAVTIGRHCFVRLDYIRRDHAAHEARHSYQAERIGPSLFVLLALWQYARFGYANAPIEVDAREYATLKAHQYTERHA